MYDVLLCMYHSGCGNGHQSAILQYYITATMYITVAAWMTGHYYSSHLNVVLLPYHFTSTSTTTSFDMKDRRTPLRPPKHNLACPNTSQPALSPPRLAPSKDYSHIFLPSSRLMLGLRLRLRLRLRFRLGLGLATVLAMVRVQL